MAGAARAAAPARGLTARILLLILVAALATAAVAAAVVIAVSSRASRDGERDELGQTAGGLAALAEERDQRLQLAARLLAVDPVLGGLLAAPAEKPETAEAAGERLRQLRGVLGFDLALLVAPGGAVVASSERQAAAALPAGDPLLTGTGSGGSVGVRVLDGRLVQAVAVPLVRDFEVLGTAVAALAVDDVLAVEVSRAGGAEVAFAIVDGRLAGASGDGAAARRRLELLTAGGGLEPLLAGASRARFEPPGGGFRALIVPLVDARGEPAGAAVVSAPVPAAGTLPLALAGIAVAALAVPLLLVPLAVLVARRASAPAGRLAAAVAAARHGDYDQRIDPHRAGPLAELAEGLDGLLADLRERGSLAAVAAAAGDGGAEAELAEGAETTATLAAVDLRRYAGGRVGLDARETADRLSRDLARIEAAAAARGGRLEAVLGQRVLTSFDGDRAAERALGAAAEVLAALSRRDSSFDESEPPALALASGRVVRGAAALSRGVEPTVVGTPVQLLDSLLREAAAGELVLGPGLARALAEPLAAAGVEPASRPGLLSPRPIEVLDSAAAARAAGLDREAPAAGEAAAGEAAAPDPWDSPTEQRVAGPAALGPGDRLGDRFEIVALLGTGPAGSLFRARDKELGEVVALKVFEPAALTDAGQFERLDSDLQRVRKLIHPNIARTYDLGRAAGLPFLARELVAGTALADLVTGDRRLPPPAALRLARQLAEALAEAHGEGLVHGRLGLHDLLLDPTGRLRVTDFGVALVARPAPAAADRPLAPEQAAGRPAGPPADVWAAGAAIHRAVTGGWPGAGSAGASAPPAELAAVLAGCLDPDPGRRPADGAALVGALDRVRL